jgi:hypothetical protein
MYPYAQDLAVTYRRMRDRMARSERVRVAMLARCGAELPPVALRDPSELLNVAGLRVGEPGCCADEQIAS